MSEDLYEKLNNLSESDVYPFHMPGHKRQDVRKAILNAPAENIAEDGQNKNAISSKNSASIINNTGKNGENFLEENWYPEKFDITEIDGFDNLHKTTGVLKEINKRLAALYGIKNARMLVGGSTTGILSAIFATLHPGDIILLARNCHMSVYHAALLSHAKVKFLYPERSGIVSTEKVKMAFEEDPEIKEVIITDPTYEGMKSDIKKISEIVHVNNALLLVDAAHGAHLIKNSINANDEYKNQDLVFSGSEEKLAIDEKSNIQEIEKTLKGSLPKNKLNSKNSGRQRGRISNAVEIRFPHHPIDDGADIAISSLHKTLPALTGTAEILFSDALSKEFVQKTDDAIDIFETSSPSYLMMASISNCVDFLEKKGKTAYAKYENRLKKFYKETAKLTFPKVLSPENRDPSKVVIMAGNGVSGYEIMDILRRKYHLELEEASENYCLAMTSIMDTDEGFKRLKIALVELNKRYKKKQVAENTWILPDFQVLDGVENPAEKDGRSSGTERSAYAESKTDSEPAGFTIKDKKVAELFDFSSYYFARKNKVSEGSSIGKTAAGFVEIYPPGVPFIFPGLKLTEDMVKYIETAKKNGAEIIGQIDDEAK